MNLVAFIFAIALVSMAKANTTTLFCYWGSWSVYRWGQGELRANQINPHTCTHLVYAFARIDRKYEIDVGDLWSDLSPREGGHKDSYRKFVALKAKNPKLKVLLSVGGWKDDPLKFSQMAYNESSRNTFVSSVMNLLARYKFDGLDVAWEWPTKSNLDQDKQNYVFLLQQLRKKFTSKNYVLSIPAPAIYDDSAYNLTQIMKYVDFVSVFAFGYVADIYKLHHSSPLYNLEENTFSVSNSIKTYLAHGAKAEQLLLGVTLYAQTFKFRDSKNTNVGAAAVGRGDKGPYTQEKGVLAWFELCSIYKYEEFTEINNSTDKTTHALNEFEWISYESNFSLLEKVAYAKTMNLAGLTVWSIDVDDNHNSCGDSLTSVIFNAL